MSARISLAAAFVAFLAVGCSDSTNVPSATGGQGGASGAGGTAGDGGTAGGAGAGGSGATGGVIDLCADVDCSDSNDCTIDPTCNSSTGLCEGGRNTPADTPCGDDSHYCDGAGRCVSCTRDEHCPGDANECTRSWCDDGACTDVSVGGACTYMGGAGVCDDGACISANLCAPYPCENRGACVVDECNPANGSCSYANRPINTRCLGNGGRYCDATGRCVLCNEDSQCDDDNACTQDTCITGLIPQCLNLSVEDGAECEGIGTACLRGQCEIDTLDRQSFNGDEGDLTSGQWNWWRAADWLPYGFYPYGLAGFHFDFSGAGVDHEMERIRAGFYLDDYLPVAGLETGLWAIYEDRNADDPYDWAIDAQKIPVGSTQHQYRDCVDSPAVFNENIGPAPDGYVPALLGFDLDRETDFNVDEIRVRLHERLDDLYLSVFFTDYPPYDAPICYSISYALIPQHRVRALDSVRSSSAGGDIPQPIDAQRPVLQGFYVGFKDGDHHLDEFGVRITRSHVQVWLNDENDDDPYGWTVWWVDLE